MFKARHSCSSVIVIPGITVSWTMRKQAALQPYGSGLTRMGTSTTFHLPHRQTSEQMSPECILRAAILCNFTQNGSDRPNELLTD